MVHSLGTPVGLLTAPEVVEGDEQNVIMDLPEAELVIHQPVDLLPIGEIRVEHPPPASL